MSRRKEIKFEEVRIQALQEERLVIQKKTFTKWVNSFLVKVRMEIEDLFTDLADGRKLLKLLEIISGEKLGKPNTGKMRVHKIENVNKSLAFLHTKVHLESIGAEDIVDGNKRLILGLIWTIILRFQIQEIEIDVDEENESSEKRSAKDALLLWCQRKTAGYRGVNITDFSGSWRTGLGFNALIHAHRPELIQFDSLNPSQHIENLNNAFDVAYRDLGVAKLLDAEDIDCLRPDEKSVMTYVASYYHTFAKMKTEIQGSRKIANIVQQLMDVDKSKTTYEGFTTQLLEWINGKIAAIEDRNFPNFLEGIQSEVAKFKTYRTEEKPPKYRERSEVEAMLFSIQTKLKSLGQPLYYPPEGKLVHDIERAWEQLEKSEHRREVALRNALVEQEKLEMLAHKFQRKSVLREGYLREMIQVLSDPRYGSNITQVEATVKKHEAISADILAREDRFHDLSNMANELVNANYHNKTKLKKREEDIIEKWTHLLELLEKHRDNLHAHNTLIGFIRDVDAVLSQIKTMEVTLLSEDVGKHIFAIEDFVQKLGIMNSQIVVLGETVNRLNRQGKQFLDSGHKEAPALQKRLDKMNADFNSLSKLCKDHQKQLEESQVFLQFVRDAEEEEAWVTEKQHICKAIVSGKDLRAVLSLQTKHKALEDEIRARWPNLEQLFQNGEILSKKQHPEAAEVQVLIGSLKDKWQKLQELSMARSKQLEDAAEAYQYYADANEAESWMNEKLPLVSSDDYGKDEASAQSQLHRLNHLEGELKAYSVDVHRLNEQADGLIKSGITSLSLTAQAPVSVKDEIDEYVDEVQLVPTEIEVEETVYKEVQREVIEERRVPQVRALYQFVGQEIEVAKNEVMVLIHKTNDDWWNVRKGNGTEGFVPATYVTEAEPKTFRVNRLKTVKVPEKQKTKKIITKKQVIRRKKEKSPKMTAKSLKPVVGRPEDAETVDQRRKKINIQYERLLKLADDRKYSLIDAIRLFGFYFECDDFETWMKDREKMLIADDQKERVEVLKKKFESFLTDLSAMSCRIDDIDLMVSEFKQTGHSKLPAIFARQKQIHDRWARLKNLTKEKEKSLAGQTSVELFNRQCDETCEWMLEKMTKIDTDDLGNDLKTVQALQRKHQNIERELAPIEDKVIRVHRLAESVKKSHPNERSNVDLRQQELQHLWQEVQKKAKERRSRLEGAVGAQLFNNATKTLLSWVSDVKQALNSDEAAKDVATAEMLLKKHGDLGDDIRAHQDEFFELQELGETLLRNSPDAKEIEEKVILLQEERNAIERGWREKEGWLRNCLELQEFNRQADQIDASSSSHQTFLEAEELGNTSDDVEILLKRHDDFENTLGAQEERLKQFFDTASRLIQSGHYGSEHIKERCEQVVQRRQAIKEKAHTRKRMLLDSKAYHEFATDAGEMKAWIQDKLKTASDESYRDLNNLERKLKKHEAFERELMSNEGRLRTINHCGEKLIASKHYSSDAIRNILNEMNEQWEELIELTKDKGKKLRDAVNLRTYNKTVEGAREKLDEIDGALHSKDLGSDLRSVKYLLTKNEALEIELENLRLKRDELVLLGEDMANQGHFDAPNILAHIKDLDERCAELREPAMQRKMQLEESLKLHQFNFEIDSEKQWVKDHFPLASSKEFGQSLQDVQSLIKKHEKLEREINGHRPAIDKIVALCQELIEEKHCSAETIDNNCSSLLELWDDLQDLSKEREKKLQLSLKAQQFFHEANEVEAWMSEKLDILDNKDCGKDEAAVIKLLTKHKTLELEIDTYNGLVTEMANLAQKMVDDKHPDSKIIQSRQQLMLQQMKNLLKVAGARRMKLMESLQRHEYFRESAELEEWIGEQMQTAQSEDYGKDFEHIALLQKRFDDFHHHVEINADRYTQCDNLGKKLLLNNSPFSAEIHQRQEQLQTAWNDLLEQIELRDQKLHAATEIHRYNRDVGEALSRIQEKYASIPEELGRDINSVSSLMRRHEGFENDLVALEAQLQVLIDDSARLQATYPGRNAEHIAEQQAIVLENWNTLSERATKRKKELQKSCDLHRFLASVRDLTNWASGLSVTIMTEEKVRDAASAQMLKAEHERLKSEIEAREGSFIAVVEAGRTMIRDNHYASDEISEKVEQLLEVRQSLHTSWQHKKIFLEQLIDLQFFLRDAKQLDAISSSQEVYLVGKIGGSTVEEIAAQAKKHESFEKLVAAQDDKLSALNEHGVKLISQDHFDKAQIKKRIDEVAIRRAHIKELCQKRKRLLADALLYANFNRDVAEAEAWVEDKHKKLNAENLTSDVVSLEDKIKKLQKHQAFQAELEANKERILNVKSKGDSLLAKQHDEAPHIKRQTENLGQKWKELYLQTENLGRGLEEAQDMLDFNNHVEKVDAWIRDKELMVQACDTGRDYEHCTALQRRLDDVDTGMRVDDSRMRTINELADKLIRQGRSDTRAVQQRREELNQKWRALQGALDEYRDLLAGALEIHAFNRDCDDMNERILEKALALSVEDCGKDLSSVEALQRKLDALERELTAIDGKLKEHDTEARRLMQKYPDKASTTQKKFSEVTENWRNLTSKCKTRKQLLASSYTLQKFNAEMHELEAWVETMIARMREAQLGKDKVEAEHLLQLHQERKAEIDGRQEKFKALKEFGHRLVQQNHYAKEDIEDLLIHLEELRRTLSQAWEERKQMLSQCRDLQTFYERADLADDWLNSKEAFLNNDDLGDSMASVEALIRKHDAFEKIIEAEIDRIEQLEKFATELVAGKHYASADIQSRLQTVCQRRDYLKENSMIRNKKLKESKQLQLFLRNIFEVVGWIQEKLQVATDESYREQTNLQSKIQKHQAFEAELVANTGRVDAVTREGEHLIGAGHFAGMEVQTQLDELDSYWQQLMNSSRLKKDRLHDAHQALLFTRNLDELDAWMDEVENQLQSEDHGKDLSSVKKLIKKHQLLETDIHTHAENIEQIKDIASNFTKNKHFMCVEIQERADAVANRYSLLQEPVQIRRDNLEDANLWQLFLRDVDDEIAWIKEKERLATSSDLGNSLTTVQNLQKKHQGLEAEIQTHEPVTSAVISKAQQMIRSNHFAAQSIEKSMQTLLAQLQQLKDQASIRRLRLADAVESQTFYSEANEAHAWIEDKKQIIGSVDFGKDRESVESLLNKHEAIQRDVEAFGAYVARLHQISMRLIDRGHFDAANIAEKQEVVEASYKELQSLTDVRRRRLHDSKKLYKFLSEASEVAEWVHEQTAIAASEDYGTDVEHVEILIQKFESFQNNLNASEERVSSIYKLAQNLVSKGHPEPDIIKHRAEEIMQLWEDLKEGTHQRQEALDGAKQVHIFDRKADEAISWMQEKDAALVSEDFGPDLESIQILIRKHEGFERDLAAVKEQVELVISDAKRLVGLYPDAQEHISVKNDEIVEVWNLLLENAALRKEKLTMAEQLQAYFDDFRELMAWLSETMAKITAPELARDVIGAELLLARHKEYRTEIDTRTDTFTSFNNKGQQLIDDGHFMAGDIQDKVQRLSIGFKSLLDTWEKRNELYKLNLSVQIFHRDADQLESWLQQREPILRDSPLGSSIGEVEDLIRKHDDFEKTILAQENKFLALQKLTLLEEAFRIQKKEEEEQKKHDTQRKEQERLNAMKQREQQRILEERRKEGGDRRHTQENKYNKDNDITQASPQNGNATPQSHLRSGTSSPMRSRRGSLEIPENLKLSIAKDASLGGSHLRRVESLRMDAMLKRPEANMGVKRAESMKVDVRGGKRAPSFTTRKRPPKQGYKEDAEFTLPPLEIDGVLERKQELQSGGKRAAIRSWKSYYTVLCGQLMCFFKDEYDFTTNKAASPPFNIHQANCTAAIDYTKKKHVFRVQLVDGAEYLFSAESGELLDEWVKKIAFHAALPPSEQLRSYDGRDEGGHRQRPNSTSSSDSYASASEDKGGVSKNPTGSHHKKHLERNNSDAHVYVNVGQYNLPGDKIKPPIPPRSSSIGSTGGIDDYNVGYQNMANRHSGLYSEGSEYRQSSISLPPDPSDNRMIVSAQTQHSIDRMQVYSGSARSEEDPLAPPLPFSQTPSLYPYHRPPSNMSSYTSEDTEDDWQGDHNDGGNNYDQQRQYSSVYDSTEARHHSLGSTGISVSRTTSQISHQRQQSNTLEIGAHNVKSDASNEDELAGSMRRKKKWWQRNKKH